MIYINNILALSGSPSTEFLAFWTHLRHVFGHSFGCWIPTEKIFTGIERKSWGWTMMCIASQKHTLSRDYGACSLLQTSRVSVVKGVGNRWQDSQTNKQEYNHLRLLVLWRWSGSSSPLFQYITSISCWPLWCNTATDSWSALQRPSAFILSRFRNVLVKYHKNIEWYRCRRTRSSCHSDSLWKCISNPSEWIVLVLLGDKCQNPSDYLLHLSDSRLYIDHLHLQTKTSDPLSLIRMRKKRDLNCQASFGLKVFAFDL